MPSQAKHIHNCIAKEKRKEGKAIELENGHIEEGKTNRQRTEYP